MLAFEGVSKATFGSTLARWKGLNERKKMRFDSGVCVVMRRSYGRLSVDDGRDGYYGTDSSG